MSILLEEEYWVSTQNNKPSLNLMRKTSQEELRVKPQLASTEGSMTTREGRPGPAHMELQ